MIKLALIVSLYREFVKISAMVQHLGNTPIYPNYLLKLGR